MVSVMVSVMVSATLVGRPGLTQSPALSPVQRQARERVCDQIRIPAQLWVRSDVSVFVGSLVRQRVSDQVMLRIQQAVNRQVGRLGGGNDR